MKFALPSLIGVVFCLTPVKFDGVWTIPMGVLSNGLRGLAADYLPGFVLLLGSRSVVGSVLAYVKPQLFKSSAILSRCFYVSVPWLCVRILGALVAFCIFFGVGPEWLVGERTGAVVLYTLAVPIVCIFLLAGFIIPLLTDYGLMEFFGGLLQRPFRVLFGLPGRASVDCLASWMSAAVVGVMLTSQQYERGYYSAREAAVISTNFSIVSIPFCLIVAQFAKLEHLFVQFYLCVLAAGIIAAVIVPRLPPLRGIPDSYKTGDAQPDATQATTTGWKRSYQAALARASKAPDIQSWARAGIGNVADIWFGLVPPVMLIATVGIVIAEYTPLFYWLSLPWVPVLELLQVPESAAVAPALMVGFVDMFLPAVVVAGVDSELARFIVISVSIVQLVYLSEVGVFILKSPIPLNLWQLFLIFLARSVITLPVIVLMAHFLVF